MPSRQRTTRQIALLFILFYTCAALLLALGVYAFGEHALKRQLDDRIAADTAVLSQIHREGGLVALKAGIARREYRSVNNLGYLLIDRAGRRLEGDLPIPMPRLGRSTIEFRDLDGEDVQARALGTRFADGSRLIVAAETAPVVALRQTLIPLFLASLAVMSIGGLAGTLWLGRSIRSRIDKVNTTAVAIIAGDLDQRVPIGDDDDAFARLAQTFNRMLDRNSALITNLRQVSSDIAHDLRTPIAHLRQRLERVSRGLPSHDPVRREIEQAMAQSDAILSLFAALLRIAEVESGALRRYFVAMDLSAVAREICESYAPAVEDGGRALLCRIADDVRIVGDPELIGQALVNLIENAMRHTPAGTTITAGLAVVPGGGVVLSVSDDGPGIDAAQIETVTNRFVRGDKARGAPGFGLGLNLVQAIARAHDGCLSLRSKDGLVACIELATLAN